MRFIVLSFIIMCYCSCVAQQPDNNNVDLEKKPLLVDCGRSNILKDEVLTLKLNRDFNSPDRFPVTRDQVIHIEPLSDNKYYIITLDILNAGIAGNQKGIIRLKYDGRRLFAITHATIQDHRDKDLCIDLNLIVTVTEFRTYRELFSARLPGEIPNFSNYFNQTEKHKREVYSWPANNPIVENSIIDVEFKDFLTEGLLEEIQCQSRKIQDNINILIDLDNPSLESLINEQQNKLDELTLREKGGDRICRFITTN